MPQHSDLTDNQREKLKYLRAMTGQLAAMADTEKAHIISYMLGMAYIEIGDVLKGDQPLSLPISKTIRHKEKY